MMGAAAAASVRGNERRDGRGQVDFYGRDCKRKFKAMCRTKGSVACDLSAINMIVVRKDRFTSFRSASANRHAT